VCVLVTGPLLLHDSEAIDYSDLSPSNLDIVNALCGVFATHGIVTRAGEFMTVSGCGCGCGLQGESCPLFSAPPPGRLHVQ